MKIKQDTSTVRNLLLSNGTMAQSTQANSNILNRTNKDSNPILQIQPSISDPIPTIPHPLTHTRTPSSILRPTSPQRTYPYSRYATHPMTIAPAYNFPACIFYAPMSLSTRF